MEDNEILEQRAFLTNEINKKEEEWDTYRANYAGVAEYWEVQKNAYNEINALRSYLHELPLTSSERMKRNLKWCLLFLTGIGAFVFLVTYYFQISLFSTIGEVTASLNFSSIVPQVLLWGVMVVFLGLSFGIYKHYFDYGITDFGFGNVIYEVFYDANIYVYFVVVLIPLLVSSFIVADIGIWSYEAWLAWCIVSLVSTVLIFCFYFILGFMPSNIEPWEIVNIAVLSIVAFSAFIIFKLLSVSIN